MENGIQPTICLVVPWTFKKAKHSTCYAENEAFELHKWTGISSHSFLGLGFTMFGVCCSQSFSPKSADCETKPAARASVGQSPRQGWTFLTALSQSGSPPHLSHAQAIQICWLSITGNVDLMAHTMEVSLSSSSMCLCSSPHFHFICLKPTSLLLCNLSLAQHSSIDKYMYLQPGGIHFHTNLITSHWKQLPKEVSNSLNSDICKYRDSCLGDGTW